MPKHSLTEEERAALKRKRDARSAARAGFWAKRETKVDPAGVLSATERRRRAKSLFVAEMEAAKARKLGDGRHAR